jgi:hypothetical protein
LKRLVFGKSLSGLPSQVEPGKTRVFLFQFLYHSKALQIMFKATMITHQVIQSLLTLVTKRRMAKVVRKGNGFTKILVESECTCDIARNARDLHGVRQSGTQVIPTTVEKNLRLVFKSSKSAGVNHSIPVSLKSRAPFRGSLRMQTAK